MQKAVKSSEVFEQLRRQILEGEWRPGEKLPSENALSTRFGVSRVTIRTALQRLGGLGLVEARFGEGSFVRQVGPEEAMNQLLPLTLGGGETRRDALCFRQMLDGPLCEIACRRATERDVAALRTLLSRMEQAQGDAAVFARLDSEFYCRLAEISQNRLLLQLCRILDDAVQSAVRESVRYCGTSMRLEAYEQILRAFEEHDAARARRWMENNLESLCTPSTAYRCIVGMERVYAARPAIRYWCEAEHTVREISYRQYAQDIRRSAAWMEQQGLVGRNMAVLANNCYHYAVHFFAALAVGVVFVPLNFQKSWPELSAELSQAEIGCLLTDGAYAERVPEFAEYSGRVESITAYTACAEQAALHECADRDALAVILFTSGTAGQSKGVMLSQRNLFAPMKRFVDPFEDTRRAMGYPDDYRFSSFNVLPLFHIAALTSLLSWSIGGNCINLCSGVRSFYRELRAMPSDVMAVVPVLLRSIHHDVRKGNLARLGKLRIFTCGAARYDPAMLRSLVDHGYHIIQMYGLTETAGAGTWNRAQDIEHLASVGLRDPELEYKLEEGELCIKGSAVMLGYYNRPDLTAEVLRDGWFHTGDLARMDGEGYLYLTGRKNNLIILPSGENVSPEELETLLCRERPILEAIVRQRGGKLSACIYCHPERQAEARRAVAVLNRTLPLYKRITELEFAGQPLPRTANGKLKRSE